MGSDDRRSSCDRPCMWVFDTVEHCVTVSFTNSPGCGVTRGYKKRFFVLNYAILYRSISPVWTGISGDLNFVVILLGLEYTSTLKLIFDLKIYFSIQFNSIINFNMVFRRTSRTCSSWAPLSSPSVCSSSIGPRSDTDSNTLPYRVRDFIFQFIQHFP